MPEKIAVIGLGYVGMPVALALAAKFPDVRGFDIRRDRIELLKKGIDDTGEADPDILRKTTLRLTADSSDIQDCTFYIVAVPTPIDSHNKPDLSPVLAASRTVGQALKKGDVVVYESTVYPGVTEDICGPVLAEASGLSRSDFRLGYSPERINPGDKSHTLEKITKIVAGEDDKTLERIAKVYGAVVEAGLYRAQSIRIAEAAKVIENIQRDVNIALMNELALIFDRLGLRTADVLKAASTKWNFMPFSPGLVGGHCIGVDPYYLTTRAEQVGYTPEVILSGRRINNGMGTFIAQKTCLMLKKANINPQKARVGILGLTFKENVPDLRNSKVPDILTSLQQSGIDAMVHDPFADAAQAYEEYSIQTRPLDLFANLDALILAVPHKTYIENLAKLRSWLRPGGVFIDVKSIFAPEDFGDYAYWSL